MNLLAVDQGPLLECFCLHSIINSHKVVNQQQTQKMVKLANRVLVRENKQVNSVSITILQCFLMAKSFPKAIFYEFQQNLLMCMRLTAQGHLFCAGRSIITSKYNRSVSPYCNARHHKRRSRLTVVSRAASTAERSPQ